MGVVIKYAVAFTVDSPAMNLTVSNDPKAAAPFGLLLDATITCTMTRGTAGSGSVFEIRILNLPQDKGRKLHDSIVAKTPIKVSIKMGYADGGPFETVMEGLVDQVRAIVETDDLTTVVTGKEFATHALQGAEVPSVEHPKDTSVKTWITDLISGFKLAPGEVRPGLEVDAAITATVGKHSVRSGKLMDELDKLATTAKAELLIIDGKVLVGNPVKVPYRNKPGPANFDLNVNLGTLESFSKDIPKVTDADLLSRTPSKATQGFTFQVTGDPNLRPGQQVLAKIKAFDQASGKTFRIADLVHKFGPKDGYVCQGDVLEVDDKDPDKQRTLRFSKQPSAQNLVDALGQAAAKTAAAAQSSVVEIGKVKQYFAPADGDDKHLTTLYYGQRVDLIETEPSIHVGVEESEKHLFEKKPFISPFAYHKCGLVVPVYPGMKAVIAHNRGLSDDGLVAGFIWSEETPADLPPEPDPNAPKATGSSQADDSPPIPATAAIVPPASKAGDWWLCLPVDYPPPPPPADSSKTADDKTAPKAPDPPADSTKAANDLTAGNGKRVIEAKGLKITIGADKLGNIGVRPTEGDDNVFLIEHKSGTSFQIADDGTLTIVASKISIKGDLSIEGNVAIK